MRAVRRRGAAGAVLHPGAGAPGRHAAALAAPRAHRAAAGNKKPSQFLQQQQQRPGLLLQPLPLSRLDYFNIVCRTWWSTKTVRAAAARRTRRRGRSPTARPARRRANTIMASPSQVFCYSHTPLNNLFP